MTPPTWLDAHGRRRSKLACWTCGREGTGIIVLGESHASLDRPACGSSGELRGPA